MQKERKTKNTRETEKVNVAVSVKVFILVGNRAERGGWLMQRGTRYVGGS